MNLTAKFGVKLQAMKQVIDPPELQRFLPSEKIINQTKAVLSINFNVRSPDFGKKMSNETGTWYFGRADIVDLDEKQLQAMEAYIKKVLVDWKRKQSVGETSEEDKKTIVDKLNSEAFKQFFAEHCEKKGWKDVTCPV